MTVPLTPLKAKLMHLLHNVAQNVDLLIANSRYEMQFARPSSRREQLLPAARLIVTI